MHLDALDLLRSPCCHAPLTCEPREQDGADITTGTLTCTACGATYAIERGLSLLYVDNESWRPKAREAEGWVTYHKDLGIYEPGENPVDLSIPYYPEEPWIGVAHSFDLALDLLNLTGKETVLDLGAGRGWASKAFAQRGCRVVAVDVVTDEMIGLGRGKALMDHAGVYFERVIGDGENLPFAPGSFDLVFASAALHHFSDLPEAFAQVGKLLKPDGLLCAIREPCLELPLSAAAVLKRDAQPEMAVGINETRPSLVEYVQAADAAGLVIERAFAPDMGALDDQALEGHLRYVGALPPGNLRLWEANTLKGYVKFAKLRAAALANGRSRQDMRLAKGVSYRQGMELSGLLWRGGELILLARKTA